MSVSYRAHPTTKGLTYHFEPTAIASGNIPHPPRFTANDRIHYRHVCAGKLTVDTVYMGVTKSFFEELARYTKTRPPHCSPKMLPYATQHQVSEAFLLPTSLSQAGNGSTSLVKIYEQLKLNGAQSEARVAIINGYGIGYGDAIVSLTAFRELRRELSARFEHVQLVLFQHPDNLEADDLYLASGVIDHVFHLPAPLSRLLGYHCVIDVSVQVMCPNMHWLDGMLDALGIDWRQVPEERKRNRILMSVEEKVPRLRPADISLTAPRPLILFHPLTSTSLRSMPRAFVVRLLQRILADTDWDVLTTVPLPITHERIVDCSDWSTTFNRVCAIIARTSTVLTADTCVYHIADAFDIPSVILFASIKAEQRMRYYPSARAIVLGGEGNRVLGTNISEAPDDIEYVRMLWDRIDPNDVIRLVRHGIESSRALPQLRT